MPTDFSGTPAGSLRPRRAARTHRVPGARSFHILLAACVLLFGLAAGCGYDSTAPGPPPPPPEPPPPPVVPPSPIDGLWTSSAVPASIYRLTADQLLGGGIVVPATIIATPSAELFQFSAIAFDPGGTMWITSQDDSQLLGFAPGELESTGFRTATVVIGSVRGSLSGPVALAFDRQHRLWVANSENGTIVRFDPAQLASSGAPAPAVVLSGVGRPVGLAFDAAGSLWVSDNLSLRVVKYGAAQLGASGEPAPQVVLGSTEHSFGSPSGLAIDAAGNLWVANPDQQIVVSFGVNQLAASGSPAPHVVLETTASGPNLPAGLAFDEEGDLWVISVDGVLQKYDRAVLGQTGAPPPSIHLVVENSVLFWGVAFWPRPAGLPLN